VTDAITCSRMFGDFCSSFFLSPNIFLKDVLPSWLIQASFDRHFDAPNFCRARLGSKTIVEALADLGVSHNKVTKPLVFLVLELMGIALSYGVESLWWH
jgi:hypothetical protein